MKKITYVSLLLLFSLLSSSQVVVDSALDVAPYYYTHFTPTSEEQSTSFYVVTIDYTGTSAFIGWYDANINLIDTLTGKEIFKPNALFSTPFRFNNKTYYVCTDLLNPQLRQYRMQRIRNGSFMDSANLNLDTIQDGFPQSIIQIGGNSLQVTVNSIVNPTIGTIGVLHVDTNFSGKFFHKFNFDSLPTYQRIVHHVKEVNDSTWHVFFSDRFAVYNPKESVLLTDKRLICTIRRTYDLPDSTYLALGIVASPMGKNTSASTDEPALGFYRIDRMGNVLDTVSFNAYKDTIPALGVNNYSMENAGTYFINSIIYDTNSIFLASEGWYVPSNSNDERQYIYVVKTDILGNLNWEYKFGGIGSLTNLTGMCSTGDKGCVVTGTIKRNSTTSYALIIKLGPDGTITNVEFNAPETVISFYPNPIKDKLHYSVLPEANGPYTLEVLDMKGKPVMESLLSASESSIPVNLQKGFYLYQLKSEDGKVEQVGKLVVE